VEIFIIILTLAIIATIEIRDKLIKVSVGGLVLLLAVPALCCCAG
jgi:hypothetical protein